jgi:hypothetical protein
MMGWLVNNELVTTWKEAVVIQFKVQPRHLRAGTEPVAGTRLEPRTSRIRSRTDNHSCSQDFPYLAFARPVLLMFPLQSHLIYTASRTVQPLCFWHCPPLVKFLNKMLRYPNASLMSGPPEDDGLTSRYQPSGSQSGLQPPVATEQLLGCSRTGWGARAWSMKHETTVDQTAENRTGSVRYGWMVCRFRGASASKSICAYLQLWGNKILECLH